MQYKDTLPEGMKPIPDALTEPKRQFYSVNEKGQITENINVEEETKDKILFWQEHETKLWAIEIFCAIYFLAIIVAG